MGPPKLEQPLAEVWLSHAPSTGRLADLDRAALEAELAALLTSARAAWPDVEVAPEQFVRYLAERAPAGAGVEQALAAVHGTDLYLACACASGGAAAIATLEQRHVAPLAAYLRRTASSPEQVADALQDLRTKLFADGRIAEYTGRGSIEGWLRVAATRILLNMIEKQKHERPSADPELGEVLLANVDPELELFKVRYRDAFHAAFREALATLSPEERNLLRLNVIDGLNIGQIGSLRRVHRSTVARWIADIRAKILDATRSSLARHLQAPSGELDSVLALLCSQLDQSLHRFLAGSPAASSSSGEP